MKVNILKDTIPYNQACNLQAILLFILQKNPNIMFGTAYQIASQKYQEIMFYRYSYRGANNG